MKYKILVVGPSWVGDMVMSQSLYRLLVQLYSSVQIDVIAPTWSLPLLKYMPEINQAINMPVLNHRNMAIINRFMLGKALKHRSYQRAIILPNSFKSALIPFFASIPQRTGWRGEMRYGLLNDIRILNKHNFPLMVQRYAALAIDRHKIHSASDLPMSLPLPQLKVRMKDINSASKTFICKSTRPIIGLCPGTGSNYAKQWPHYHYAKLAEALIYNGYKIIVFGSIRDRFIGESISNALPVHCHVHYQNLVGRTSLEQAIALIAICRGIVSNDSGLMHVASALNRPLLVLYGPSNPEFTPPLSNQARILRSINSSHKVRKNYCKNTYHQSLIDIQPSQVLDEIEIVLSSSRNNESINY